MIITKQGFWKLEKTEYEIRSNSIIRTLTAYWSILKTYSEAEMRKKGLLMSWREDQIDPREFFNYVYISEMVRDGQSSPPALHWQLLTETYVYRGQKAPLWKKIANMYRVLEEKGWSRDRKKSRWGSMKKAAEELGWNVETLRLNIKKYPEPPEAPWENRFATNILDYWKKAKEEIGDLWFWKASQLLPPEYGEDYLPTIPKHEFKKYNEGRRELDFSILDHMYEEFSKIKLVQCGARVMVITKGEVKITDLREEPWRGTTYLDELIRAYGSIDWGRKPPGEP